MKGAKIPSLKFIAKLLADDPLRSAKAFQQIQIKSDEDFLEDLNQRLQASRFEPRLFESCLERSILYSTKMNLPIILKKLHRSCYPRLWPLLFNWAKRVDTSHKILWQSFYLSTRAIAFSDDPIHVFESFYVAFYPPGSHLSEQLIEGSDRIWERHGYLARSAPVSKELLRYLGHDQASILRLSRRGIANQVESYIREHRGEWFTLAALHTELKATCSRRQLLRYLKRVPQLKSYGTLKAMRYRFDA
jgi:hypothetical protein